MASMRMNKQKLKDLLDQADWKNNLDEIAAGGMGAVGPLFSFLLLKPEMMHRAACALGQTVAGIAQKEPETAKNVIRRFMWHMNEESGNIGWGIPDAFAECLARNDMLAKTYASILVSYVIDLGFDDNYCDNDILRRSCYWAIGRFAQARPDLAEISRKWLIKGLGDRDSICRGMAAWALLQLPASLMDVPAIKALAQSGNEDKCEIFDGNELREYTVSQLAELAWKRDEPAAKA